MSESLEVEPLDVEAWPVEVPEPRFADSCEFRLVGDDFALLWTRIPSGALARPAAAKLHVTRDGETVDVEPISFTVDPAADTVCFAFLVDRPVAKRPEVQLAITVPSQGRLELPPRVELPPFDSPDVAIESVLDATRAGDELVATTNLFERRCVTAERVADDLRSGPTESRRLAQAYRESWELRALLESREETHAKSAAAVQKAEADAAERAGEVTAARTELATLHSTLEDANALHAVELAERDATIERLEADAAAAAENAETWQTEVATAREQLAATVAESARLEHELTEARETAEALQRELGDTGDQAEAWAAEAERARTQLTEAVERMQVIHDERDAALASLAELGAALRATESQLDVEVTAARTELEHAIGTAKSELESAVRNATAERDAAVDAVRADRDAAVGAARAERDAAVSAARTECEAAVNAARAERDAAVRAAQDERDAAVRAAYDERNAAVAVAEAEREAAVTGAGTELANALREAESARAVVQDAAARADELARERDDERAARTRAEQELARTGTAAVDTEARLGREQALYEARIASAAETERKLCRRVADLEAKLAEQPRSLPGLPRRASDPIGQFADAQRARLRETTLEEQRAQVTALERQLEQLKQHSPNGGRDASPAGAAN